MCLNSSPFEMRPASIIPGLLLLLLRSAAAFRASALARRASSPARVRGVTVETLEPGDDIGRKLSLSPEEFAAGWSAAADGGADQGAPSA